jgi:hypothetical protein
VEGVRDCRVFNHLSMWSLILALGMAVCVDDRAVVKKWFPGEGASGTCSIIVVPVMASLGKVRVAPSG